MEDDPQRRKYNRLINKASQIEVDLPEVAYELYRQAEEIFPLDEGLAQHVARLKGTKSSPNILTSHTSTSISATMNDTSHSEGEDDTQHHSTTDQNSDAELTASRGITTETDAESSDPVEVLQFLQQVMGFLEEMPFEDVEELITRKNYQIISYLLERTIDAADPHVVSLTAKSFNRMGQILPDVWPVLIDRNLVDWLIRWCGVYIKSENQLDVLGDVLLLLSMMCYQQGLLNMKNKEKLEDFVFISSLVRFALDQSEYEESEVGDVSVYALFTISSQFTTYTEDPIVSGLYANQTAASLGSHFIKIINRNTLPIPFLICGLGLLQKLLDYSTYKNTDSFFFLNDVHVLIDVILREAINLEPGHVLRTYYLETLFSVLNNHEYVRGRYKLDEIKELLVHISDNEYDQKSTDMAFKILVDCKVVG
eukprot:TRINITY_DN5855_c0_g1_i1.p1 TRINITY_DN5855_c0_g1~~TRINITY_DN5855_c0_g1_i1.p1  ORF type:complete len:424 (-),score=63.99 TRINITY_DN5855_c0_g1_i1:14-1285(-)